MTSRLYIDMAACSGHGLCADLLPELVDTDEWGFPIVSGDAVDPGLLPLARRAVRTCPTLALRLLTAEEPEPYRAHRKAGHR